jgi:hypothetical protein
VQDEVRARRFVVVDAEDQPLAALAEVLNDEGEVAGAGLAILDKDGHQAATLSVHDAVGPALVLRDPEGNTAMVFAVDGTQPLLNMDHNDGRESVSLSFAADGPTVMLRADGLGKLALTITALGPVVSFLDPGGHIRLAIASRPGAAPRLETRDASGAVFWSEPDPPAGRVERVEPPGRGPQRRLRSVGPEG